MPAQGAKGYCNVFQSDDWFVWQPYVPLWLIGALLVSYMPLARLHFDSAARQAQGRSAALKALSGIASSASQRSWTQAALANMPWLAALLTAALASAETPKYCGRAGSGVDELRAPQTEASLKSVQAVSYTHLTLPTTPYV